MPEAAPLAPFGHSEQNGVCFRELIPSPSLSNFGLNASSRQLATTVTTTLVAWSPTYDQRPRDQKPYMVANIRPRSRPLWSRGREFFFGRQIRPATTRPKTLYGRLHTANWSRGRLVAISFLVVWSPTYDQRPCDQKPYMVADLRPAGRVVANLRPRSRPLWSRGREVRRVFFFRCGKVTSPASARRSLA